MQEWDEKYQDMIDWIQSYYNQKYTAVQVEQMAELLRWEIPPRRLMKVAKHVCMVKETKSLPLASHFLKANKETPYSPQSKHYTACPDCNDTGFITVHVKHGNRDYLYTENMACSCALGQRHVRDWSTDNKRKLRTFHYLPGFQEAVNDGRIYFEDGTAFSAKTDEIVMIKFGEKSAAQQAVEKLPQDEILF